jgi:hypothetical protein
VLYGLQLEANIQIPGLLPQLKPEEADVRIHLKNPEGFPTLIYSDVPEFVYVSPNIDEAGRPVVRVAKFGAGVYFVFQYSDGPRFVVDGKGQEIWADWPDQNYTVEDATTYLIGPVIGFVLRLRGALLLHASAVTLGDRAIALMGGPGVGKSTTAAEFARLGHAVLSDDLAALRESGDRFLVQPGYPRVNLWPDSVQSVLGAENSLPCICPSWDKRFIALGRDGMRFERTALPLSAIYILGKRETELTAPVIKEMEGSAALVDLVKNTYVNYLLDSEMRRNEFSALSRLLAKIPVRSVKPSADPTLLPVMCNAISADAKKLVRVSSVSTHAGSN